MRASKTTADATVEHIWDGADIIADVADGAATRYVRGANLILSSAGGATAYYSYNAHGDVVQLTDNAGAVTKGYGYDAFGVEEAPDEGDSNPFRYCGEYWDSETGTYYLRARYYAPGIGRFWSEDTHWGPGNMVYGDNPAKWNERQAGSDDPMGLNAYTYVPAVAAVMQSGNLYVYCMGNPARYVDPTGELAWPGEIHNQVMYRVAAKYVLNKEQQINYSVGWGWADLVSDLGQVWDVKRDKPKQIASGVKQVQKYIANTWKNKPDIVLSIGGWIDPDSFVYPSGVTTYYVSYRYAGNGVIAYDYYAVTDWQKIGEIATGVVLIGGAAFLIYATGGMAAPILVPLLA
jgi:RHS repeat-associated protein